MAKNRIKMNTCGKQVKEVFQQFLSAKVAQGISEKTAITYRSHFQAVQKHINLSVPFQSLTQEDIDNSIVSMRQAGLAHNAISSYTRVFRTVLRWCCAQGYTTLTVPTIRDQETVKKPIRMKNCGNYSKSQKQAGILQNTEIG